jgi:hypothetical protein
VWKEVSRLEATEYARAKPAKLRQPLTNGGYKPECFRSAEMSESSEEDQNTNPEVRWGVRAMVRCCLQPVRQEEL